MSLGVVHLVQPSARRNERGSQVAEAAVVLPILFMFLLGIYWFGHAFSIYGSISHAAREGARTAAVPRCATCSSGCSWAGSMMPCDAPVVNAVNQILLSAHLDPAKTAPTAITPAPQPCPNVVPAGICGTASSGGMTICRNVWLNQSNITSPPVCGVIVSFQYPYQFALPFTSLNNQKIWLKAQVEMRGED